MCATTESDLLRDARSRSANRPFHCRTRRSWLTIRRSGCFPIRAEKAKRISNRASSSADFGDDTRRLVRVLLRVADQDAPRDAREMRFASLGLLVCGVIPSGVVLACSNLEGLAGGNPV